MVWHGDSRGRDPVVSFNIGLRPYLKSVTLAYKRISSLVHIHVLLAMSYSLSLPFYYRFRLCLYFALTTATLIEPSPSTS
jgi:hypothetical protein